MTNEQLIARTKALRSQSDKEWHEYLDGVIGTLEKQIPKKPTIKIHDNRVPHEQEQPYCPNCDEWIGWQGCDMKHCDNCGQALDWGDDYDE